MERDKLKAAKLVDQLELGGKLEMDAHGSMTLDDEVVESTLPEGVTMKTVKAIQDHRAAFEAAVTLGAGEKAAEHFANGGKEASVRYQFGKDTSQVFFKAGGEGENPEIRNVLRVHGADRGEVKKVHGYLSETFSKLNS